MDLNLILASIDWTPIITNVLLAVVTIVVGVLGKAARDFTVANKNNKEFALVTSIIEQGVQFAEQVYESQDGDTKKAAAIDYVERELAKQGIKVDLDLVADAVEAAVMREFNYDGVVGEPYPNPEPPIVVAESVSPAQNLN